METLLGLSLDIARKAFIRIRDVRYIELLNRIEIARKQKRSSAALAAAGGDTALSLSKTTADDTIFLADILAYQGRYDEASRLYLRCGQRKKAIEMFLDLRDWAKAKEIVEAAQAAQRDGMLFVSEKFGVVSLVIVLDCIGLCLVLQSRFPRQGEGWIWRRRRCSCGGRRRRRGRHL